MQITSISHGDLLELHTAGRLDAEWAPTLRAAIDDALRQGYHAVVLDAGEIQYVSSAGLSVLVSAHKQFQAIHGFFGVGGVSGAAEQVIRLSGLGKMLLCDIETARRARGQGRSTIQLPSHVVATDVADFEVYDLQRDAELAWVAFGDPTRFDRGAYTADDVTELTCKEDSFAVGLGAFGDRFENCATRFGELLSVAGCVAALPGNGASLPDYQTTRGDFVPAAQMLYGLTCTGEFARLLRFDSDDEDRRVSLTGLVNQALTLTESDASAFVILAETSGLVGAALRRPPIAAPATAESRFDHPEIREWLFYTPERAFPHSLAVIAGVAMRAPHARVSLSPHVRPMSSTVSLHGHFHAAVFSFQAFKKRRIELVDSVRSLFDAGQPQGLLHLIHDERPISGAGDSEFLRGAVWIGPLATAPELGR